MSRPRYGEMEMEIRWGRPAGASTAVTATATPAAQPDQSGDKHGRSARTRCVSSNFPLLTVAAEAARSCQRNATEPSDAFAGARPCPQTQTNPARASR